MLEVHHKYCVHDYITLNAEICVFAPVYRGYLVRSSVAVSGVDQGVEPASLIQGDDEESRDEVSCVLGLAFFDLFTRVNSFGAQAPFEPGITLPFLDSTGASRAVVSI
ncbi:hypothetical protein [Robbsia sp. KACC 23696]|uniref:hypothetical protein n=1 Tax=Robbsia sp. KACC 23696 TaxID=3149231 RepID=UPI00325AE752